MKLSKLEWFYVLVMCAVVFLVISYLVNKKINTPYCPQDATVKTVLEASTLVMGEDGNTYGRYKRICVSKLGNNKLFNFVKIKGDANV